MAPHEQTVTHTLAGLRVIQAGLSPAARAGSGGGVGAKERRHVINVPRSKCCAGQ